MGYKCGSKNPTEKSKFHMYISIINFNGIIFIREIRIFRALDMVTVNKYKKTLGVTYKASTY